jgi:L-lactate dehydrogenase (cytochrome)
MQMLGTKVSIPIYITATALGKLGHPDGEKNLTWAAAKHDVIQMIPTLASYSFDDIRGAAVDSQTQWMQLYVNKDRAITEKIVKKAEAAGIKGLFITVDAPQLGRREKDMRMKFADTGSNVQQGDGSVDKSQGAARAISSFIDPGLSWKDIPWFKSITKMPLILKGVQCWEDAVMAAEAGCQGVVLSNHGGRQLDFARSGIEILVEVMDELNKRGLNTPKFEVYIDGGVRRAGDVLKAICLGAKGVGIGRPFLYVSCNSIGRLPNTLFQTLITSTGLLGIRCRRCQSRSTAAQGRDGDEHAPDWSQNHRRAQSRDDRYFCSSNAKRRGIR